MALNSIAEIIDDIRHGKMVILMDDEDRENEGDLILAAEHCTAEHINFMARYARGLICLTVTEDRCRQLNLPLMVEKNGASHGTNFTLSIEAAQGVTTGISAADRAHTVRTAVAKQARADDIVQPGHIFPLMAKRGGVLDRTGHTEAGCDLARIAGCEPAAVIVEIMNEDGTMARRPDLEVFAQQHNLKIGTIADLIHYRFENERTVEVVDRAPLHTDYGDFELWTFRNKIDDEQHFALVKGNVTPNEPTLVRVHLATAMRDLFCAQPPEMKIWNIRRCLEKVAQEGKGVVVLIHQPETTHDILASALAMQGKQSLQPASGREQNVHKTVGVGAQILREIGVRKMRVMGQPIKYRAISGYDLEVVEHIPCD